MANKLAALNKYSNQVKKINLFLLEHHVRVGAYSENIQAITAAKKTNDIKSLIASTQFK